MKKSLSDRSIELAEFNSKPLTERRIEWVELIADRRWISANTQIDVDFF